MTIRTIHKITNEDRVTELKHSNTIVLGCLETLQQGREFLQLLSEEDYTFVAQPHATSSIGEHYRHWLDLFHAIRIDPSRIDYNVRRRGHQVERHLLVAQGEINQLVEWLTCLSSAQIEQAVTVETETLLSQTQVEELESTLARELTFAALHATHHFAMAKVIASLRGIQSKQAFGVAPTTVSFQKAQ